MANALSAGRGAPRRVASLVLAALGLGAMACEAPGASARVTIPADSAAGEVRFEMLQPGDAAIVVPAVINGRAPVDLLLDTGATLTCVDEALAREMELPDARRTIASGVSVGGAGTVRLVRVDSLRVGAASVSAVTVCTLDLAALQRLHPGVRGLLGLNFLRNFDVALDFDRQVVRFSGRE